MKRNLLILPAIISLIAAAPATGPTTRPQFDPKLTDFLATARTVQKLVPHLSIFQEAQKRTALAPEAIAALNQFFIKEKDAQSNKTAGMLINALDTKYRAELIAFGGTLDPDAAPDKHPDESKQLAAFLMADNDKQTAMVADVNAKLNTDVNDPAASLLLTEMQANSEAVSSDLKSTLSNMTSDAKTARRTKTTLASVVQAKEENRARIVDKPLVLEGTLADGTTFSTASYKGKVVLVDFWATWCIPCKFGLPHVKETYKKYHADGLELVSVSNDYSGDALRAFLKSDPEMPWPEFFDAKAAASHTWNPITTTYGIDSIPRMFLIDRKGICRSITARTDMDALIPKLLAEPADVSVAKP